MRGKPQEAPAAPIRELGMGELAAKDCKKRKKLKERADFPVCHGIAEAGPENPTSVKFQLIIQSVVIQDLSLSNPSS